MIPRGLSSSMTGSGPRKRSGKRVFKVGGEIIRPGERRRIQINLASLYDYTQLSIPVEVIRGKEDGPKLFISAAIHGDEINGIEIIKRVLRKKDMKSIRGTVILIPIVNVFGFNTKSRYLPDRRDLNRCFPGNDKGSLGSRIAKIFMREIVSKCTHGIDLHTGAIHRSNLPQVRASLDDSETKKLAHSFGVPVVIDSKLRDGSLREAARKKNIKTLLFEGGEALRFDESVIKSGVYGCMSVMREIGMLPAHSASSGKTAAKKAFIANRSQWLRANHSGSFHMHKSLGQIVRKGERIATISNPFGDDKHILYAETSGIIVGLSSLPLVNKGDAMVHVATFDNSSRVRRAIERFDEVY
jgi:predicted deacylase